MGESHVIRIETDHKFGGSLRRAAQEQTIQEACRASGRERRWARIPARLVAPATIATGAAGALSVLRQWRWVPSAFRRSVV